MQQSTPHRWLNALWNVTKRPEVLTPQELRDREVASYVLVGGLCVVIVVKMMVGM